MNAPRLAVAALPALLMFLGSALAPAARADGDEETDTAWTLEKAIASTPVGPCLEKAHIGVRGWLDGSAYTTPGTQSPTRVARVFDDDAEGVRLQQAYFAVERTTSDERCFDVGGKVAALWGTDARLLHARGLLDDQGSREEQFDLLEAYAALRFSILKGLTVKLGKCDTPLGFEVIEPVSNPLPSRSFLFGYAIPFTHTGGLATLEVNGAWKVTYGLVRGWDVWEDNNDSLTHIAGVSWTSPCKTDTVTVNAIVGPERANEDDDLRKVVDVTWSHGWNDVWTTVLNADVGHEEGAAANGDGTLWWGAAGYLTGKLCDRLSVAARLEVFRDEEGVRLGAPAKLGEATLGLDWRPFPCQTGLHVRPEVRWDHSFDGRFFDGGDDADQVSLALEVLFEFS